MRSTVQVNRFIVADPGSIIKYLGIFKYGEDGGKPSKRRDCSTWPGVDWLCRRGLEDVGKMRVGYVLRIAYLYSVHGKRPYQSIR